MSLDIVVLAVVVEWKQHANGTREPKKKTKTKNSDTKNERISLVTGKKREKKLKNKNKASFCSKRPRAHQRPLSEWECRMRRIWQSKCDLYCFIDFFFFSWPPTKWFFISHCVHEVPFWSAGSKLVVASFFFYRRHSHCSILVFNLLIHFRNFFSRLIYSPGILIKVWGKKISFRIDEHLSFVFWGNSGYFRAIGRSSIAFFCSTPCMARKINCETYLLDMEQTGVFMEKSRKKHLYRNGFFDSQLEMDSVKY